MLRDPERRYAYHSFPRRGATRDRTNQKGLAILRSMVQSGLLLRLETIAIPGEYLANGTVGPEGRIGARFASFTVRTRRSLAEAHARDFGPFAIQLELQKLIELGALPVWYVPIRAAREASGGRTLLARAVEIRHLLERLKVIDDALAAGAPVFQLTLNGAPVVEMTRVSAQSLMRLLSYAQQPVAALEAADQVMGSLTYPIDAGDADELRFFEQREWRIVSNVLTAPVYDASPPTEEERTTLLAIDHSYWSKTVEARTGAMRRLDGCRFLRTARGRHFLEYASQAIVPERVLAEASKILRRTFPNLELVSFESLRE